MKKPDLKESAFRKVAVHDPLQLRLPASPYDKVLSRSALAWMRELPREVAPVALAMRFPRIVNRLSRFWDSPRMIDECFQDLLVDRRGKRLGFPRRVLEDLHRLAEYHAARGGKRSTDRWESVPYRKDEGPQA